MIHSGDLLALKELLWPDVLFYDKQVEIIQSTIDNVETYVPAANKMGKDFIGGFISVAGFLACMAKGISCRIITTSVAEHHLKVLWGEIGRFVVTSRRPLTLDKGGPLVMNYQEVRRASEIEARNPLNYLAGRVSAKGEGLAGHHADWTLIIGDESSGLDDKCHEMAQGWAKHMLWIGNPNSCVNFWFKGIEAGDLLMTEPQLQGAA